MHRLLVQIAPLQKHKEEIVDHLLMVFSVRGGEQVEGYTQLVPRFQELGMVPVQHFFGGYPLLFSPNGDRRSVAVAARHHEDFIAFDPVVAREMSAAR